jgi:hypothetical protein
MPKIVRGRRVLIPGPVLVGFAEFFDRSYGNPKTPKVNGGYPIVTPSKIGQTLLPFVCIYCDKVQSVDPKQVTDYTDNQRGFSWCPSCRGRYVLDTNGQPLTQDLPPGAEYAPAVVRSGEETRVIGKSTKDGFTLLGVI